MIRNLLACVTAVALLGFVGADEAKMDLKSGPQVGEKVPGPFEPMNVTGDKAGEKACLFCKNGDNPVICIFARTCECPGLAKLVKAVEETTAKNTDAKLGSFIVVVGEEEKLDAKLKKWAEDNGLKSLIVSFMAPSKLPEKYNINNDADITVLLYVKKEVKANHAFKKGEITEENVKTITGEVSKILPETTK